jgi:hypothetical protein
MSFGFCMDFAGAACHRLGWVDLMEHFAHRQALMDKLGNKLLLIEPEFSKCAMVFFPVDHRKLGWNPPLVFIGSSEHCGTCGHLAEVGGVVTGDLGLVYPQGDFA